MKEKKTYKFLELNGLDNTHTIESINMSQRFIKELAQGHDSCTEYGKASIGEINHAITEMDPKDWNEGDVPVLALIENDGEPGDDFIVIYNYEGSLRMTGIAADSHSHCYIYKVSQI
tara:strand:+ start:63 stop:413 length:351 start_codon:yes stop_codon:yes gene_type:complete